MLLSQDQEESEGYSTLAKLAAICAAVFLICLGICGYSTKHVDADFGGGPGFVSFIGMAISFVSFLAICAAALFRLVRDRYYK